MSTQQKRCRSPLEATTARSCGWKKNYLQEQSPALECTCFQNGGRLLEQLRQGRQFDVVILCSQLEDMSGLEFLMNIRSMDPKPNVCSV